MDGRATDDDGQGTRDRAREVMRARPHWLGPSGPLRGALADVRSAGLPGHVASLTFHGALCVLAGLASLIGLVGLVGTDPGTSDAILEVIRNIGAGTGALDGPLQALIRDKQAAVLLLVGGLGSSVLVSAGYLRVFRRASRPLTQARSEAPVGREPYALARVIVALSIVLTGLCVVVTGALAHAIGDAAGISGDSVLAWDIVKWPVVVTLAFVAFAGLQRSAFSDPRVLASTTVGSVQVVAAFAWVVAITGFALYLASFGTFEEAYGTVGSGVVLLVWVTMLSMLYYVTPDLRVAGIAALGAGAALSAATWLLTCAALAVCVAAFDVINGTVAALVTATVFLAGLWVSNVVVLLGVRLNALGVARANGHPVASLAADSARGTAAGTPSRDRAKVFRAVSTALRNDEAHAGKLAPVAADDEQATLLGDFELDLLDWGFTYGAAWAFARAQDPDEPDEAVADRALGAARQVFRLYCGEDDWEGRIGSQLQSGRDEPAVVPYSRSGNGHGSLDLRR